MRASARPSSRTSDLDPSQPAAEAAIERFLASWQSAGPRGLESAHLWEDAAMEAIDALSALLGAVDLAESAPRLISQRSPT